MWLEELAIEDARVLLRVGVAMLLAAPLGWERERKDRPAGLRTHLLVALASALLVSLAKPMVEFVHAGDGLRYDPLRVFEAVMTGVAFLGAGTIFVHRKEGVVHGLTTAGSLLAAATIGTASALERWIAAAGTSAYVVIVLLLLGWLERRTE